MAPAVPLSSSAPISQSSYSVLHDIAPVETPGSSDVAAPSKSNATPGKVASKTVTTKTGKLPTYQSAKEIETIVKAYFKDIPLLASIAKCESHYRQYTKSGEIYRGSVNTSDVGVMQINEHYHLKTAEKMGLDIYSIEGNMAYARYLYKNEGSAPWVSSGGCWDSSREAKKATNLALNSKKE